LVKIWSVIIITAKSAYKVLTLSIPSVRRMLKQMLARSIHDPIHSWFPMIMAYPTQRLTIKRTKIVHFGLTSTFLLLVVGINIPIFRCCFHIIVNLPTERLALFASLFEKINHFNGYLLTETTVLFHNHIPLILHLFGFTYNINHFIFFR